MDWGKSCVRGDAVIGSSGAGGEGINEIGGGVSTLVVVEVGLVGVIDWHPEGTKASVAHFPLGLFWGEACLCGELVEGGCWGRGSSGCGIVREWKRRLCICRSCASLDSRECRIRGGFCCGSRGGWGWSFGCDCCCGVGSSGGCGGGVFGGSRTNRFLLLRRGFGVLVVVAGTEDALACLP